LFEEESSGFKPQLKDFSLLRHDQFVTDIVSLAFATQSDGSKKETKPEQSTDRVSGFEKFSDLHLLYSTLYCAVLSMF